MKQEIEKFRKETGVNLVVKDGKPFYSGSLDLSGTGFTALPDNLTVGGYLDLSGTGITALSNNLTVGGSLYLRGTGITALPNNLTVGGSLYLRGTGITALPNNLTVGGSLDLSGTGFTALPNNLTVGDYLDLENCTGITALPNNLTVGGSLDLRGTGITGEVKVNKNLSPKAIAAINRVLNRPIFWKWNSRSYIKVDDMFTAIDSHHGNVYRVHKLNSREQLYLVTDGENHWAHGSTLQNARADLIFKINDRDTSVYKNMSLDDTLTYEEAIAAYRTITGACAAGTKDYIENRLPKPHKEKYTVQEMITLTGNEYGGKKFSEFFKK